MIPVGVGSKERREAVGKSVVSAVLVINIVTRTVMRLWAIGGGGGGGRKRVASSRRARLVNQAIPCTKGRRERRKRVVAQRFRNPLEVLGRAGTGAGWGSGRPGAAPHWRVLYAKSESEPEPGHSRGWGWGYCGHVCWKWVLW